MTWKAQSKAVKGKYVKQIPSTNNGIGVVPSEINNKVKDKPKTNTACCKTYRKYRVKNNKIPRIKKTSNLKKSLPESYPASVRRWNRYFFFELIQ
jgi:hypothetical protein